jgi:hypothetical protein
MYSLILLFMLSTDYFTLLLTFVAVLLKNYIKYFIGLCFPCNHLPFPSVLSVIIVLSVLISNLQLLSLTYC